MCVIVDASVCALAFGSPTDREFVPLIRWLFGAEGRLALGGKLTKELSGNAAATTTLAALKRAGRLVEATGAELDPCVAALTPRCSSNDPHVLAVALATGARTLCTADAALMDDFKDQALISRPGGKVYQYATHRRLPQHVKGCPGPLP